MALARRNFFVWRDLLFVSCLVFALLFFYFFAADKTDAGGVKYAEITVDGQLVEKAALSRNGLFTPLGRSSVRIAVRDDAAGFVFSDCPDKICLHTGFLSAAGQSAACLPNRVVVRIVSETGNFLDSTTY